MIRRAKFGSLPRAARLLTRGALVAPILLGAWCATAEPLPGVDDAARDRPEEERRLLRFALERFAAGDFPRAATEGMRFASYHPDSPLADSARMVVAASYARAQRWDEAVGEYRGIARRSPDGPLAPHARYQEAMTLYDAGRLEEAASAFENLPDPWAREGDYLSVLARIRGRSWEEAASTMARERDNPSRPEGAPDPAEIRAGRDLPGKSPGLAGTLSAILPGSGQMYAGRPSDGLHAFFWTALFAVATVEAAREDLDAPAVIGGTLFLTFYVANIRNAAVAARARNDAAEDGYASWLAERALPHHAAWDPDPDPAALRLGMRWRY